MVNRPPQQPQDDAQEVLAQEAWVWVQRLAAEDVSQWDVQAARRWLARSPQHQAAFEHARQQWKLLKPSLGNVLQSHPAVAARHEHALRGGPRMARRAFLGAAVGATGVAALALAHPPWGLWPSWQEWDADVRTAAGQQHSLKLSKRVAVTLNSRSSIRHLREGMIPGVRLVHGEAVVDLTGQGASFAVAAGPVLCVADAGSFAVRHIDGRTRATCLQGTMQVQYRDGSQILQPGHQLTLADGVPGALSRVDAQSILAWRNGELWFDQTPLAEVIEEINRHRAGRVVLLGAAQRGDALSGRFQLAALDEVLVQIQHSFALQRRDLPGGVVVLS